MSQTTVAVIHFQVLTSQCKPQPR